MSLFCINLLNGLLAEDATFDCWTLLNGLAGAAVIAPPQPAVLCGAIAAANGFCGVMPVELVPADMAAGLLGGADGEAPLLRLVAGIEGDADANADTPPAEVPGAVVGTGVEPKVLDPRAARPLG